MSISRSFATVALAGFLSASASANLLAPAANPKSHAHHLLKAEEDLVAAEGSIVANNLTQAHKHVAAAIHQLEEAIKHHHQHHISQPANSGLSGTISRAHHRHHATLHQAVTELRAAEKQLKAGNGALASKDIQLAAKTIKAAITSHNNLIKA